MFCPFFNDTFVYRNLLLHYIAGMCFVTNMFCWGYVLPPTRFVVPIFCHWYGLLSTALFLIIFVTDKFSGWSSICLVAGIFLQHTTYVLSLDTFIPAAFWPPICNIANTFYDWFVLSPICFVAATLAADMFRPELFFLFRHVLSMYHQLNVIQYIY